MFGQGVEQLQEMAVELLGYLEEQIFSEQEEDDIKDQEEKLDRKRNILACYCKLVVMELLPVKYFNRVMSRYNSSFLQFGDIIKAAMMRLRESSKTVFARAMLNCLVDNLDKIEGEVSVKQLEEEKQLARRLALVLGLDGMKNREAVVLIHKEGLQMALGQGRERVKLLFMLAEFSVKLIEQDRSG